jgi:protein tyrosine/serine phosphatase
MKARNSVKMPKLKKTKRIFLSLALIVGLSCVSYAAYCGILIKAGNFHAVDNGLFYRSAQPDQDTLADDIGDHHIKSILNLRGANPGIAWYDNELAVAQKYNVAHYDVGISAEHPVAPEKIEQILNVLRDAPKPILVHCQSGSDRAGFVSALYLYAIAHRSADIAARQLSLWYGHFPYLISKTDAMDASFAQYVALNR